MNNPTTGIKIGNTGGDSISRGGNQNKRNALDNNNNTRKRTTNQKKHTTTTAATTTTTTTTTSADNSFALSTPATESFQAQKSSKRALQLQSMRKKADDEDQYFRQCRRAQRTLQTKRRTMPTETELFGQQGSQGINFAKYSDIQVEVRRGETMAKNANTHNNNVVPVVFDHDDFQSLPSLPPTLRRNISLMNYRSLTPIQKHAIPLGLAGDDLMCCAQTGSGKTCAFLVPIISRLLSQPPSPSSQHVEDPATPRCVILAPTRELAIQIELECQKLCYNLQPQNIFSTTVYGGANPKGQLKALAEGAELVVATPGRLADFVDRNLVSLANVQHLVLDEADRMMDMGFLPQIRRLILDSDMTEKKQRQTMMFSATFDAPIQKLAAAFLRDTYAWIAVGRVGSTTDSITQTIVLARNDKRHKLALVVAALTKGPKGRTLIFVQKKRSATWLKKMLVNGGPSDGDRFEPILAEDIHGDRSQSQRETALSKFRSGDCRVLVATDVAARGLDINGVEHVINMDLPLDKNDFDSYVHRIGRTGRAGHTGLATSLFVPNDHEKIAPLLSKHLKETKQEVPVWLEELVVGSVGSGGGGQPGAGRGAIGSDVRRNTSSEGRGSGRRGGRDSSARGSGHDNNAKGSGRGGGDNVRGPRRAEGKHRGSGRRGGENARSPASGGVRNGRHEEPRQST